MSARDSVFSDELLRALAGASSVAVLTGAGVSAESGVPTFRDPGGLWSRFRPEELASFDAFLNNPELVWEWYEHRRKVIRSVAPNPGHFALAEMETMYPDFTLITQNVDGLHRRAGSKAVVELHGNIERSFCIACKSPWSPRADESLSGAPLCSCGGRIRPEVVWFGESLPAAAVRDAWAAAGRCGAFLTIGTSGEVYPAAQLPSVAREGGAYVAEINPRRSSIAHRVHECIEASSGVALPVLVEQLRKLRLSA